MAGGGGDGEDVEEEEERRERERETAGSRIQSSSHHLILVCRMLERNAAMWDRLFLSFLLFFPFSSSPPPIFHARTHFFFWRKKEVRGEISQGERREGGREEEEAFASPKGEGCYPRQEGGKVRRISFKRHFKMFILEGRKQASLSYLESDSLLFFLPLLCKQNQRSTVLLRRASCLLRVSSSLLFLLSAPLTPHPPKKLFFFFDRAFCKARNRLLWLAL